MNNKYLKDLWKIFCGGATVLAYKDWFKTKTNDQLNEEFQKNLKENMNEIREQYNQLKDNLSKALDEQTKNEIQNKIKELTSWQSQINKMEGIHKNYTKKFENGDISSSPEVSEGIYQTYKDQIEATFNLARSKTHEIDNLLEKTKDKFTDDFSVFNLIKDFKEYLGTLSHTELCLLINITSGLFILFCILSIISAVLGNYLIEKFSLEQKFPRLNKIIQLRVKLQYYYIIINSVFILIAIVPLIYVNLATLLNW